MENPTALFQIIRPIMNENVTPEEEWAVMNWVAARPQDELRAIHESAPAMFDLHRSFQDLREKNVGPADPEAQELVSRLNEVVVRSGARLVGQLRQICADYSLGDPLVYVRWAGAMELRWLTEDSKRRHAAWAFLANAIECASNAP